MTVGSLLFYFRSLIIGLRYACFEVSHTSIYCCIVDQFEVWYMRCIAYRYIRIMNTGAVSCF